MANLASQASGPPSVSIYPDWRAVMGRAVTDTAKLCQVLGLAPETAVVAEGPAQEFPLLVPPTYLARIRPGDLQDPLLLQILPKMEEAATNSEFTTDPVGESTPAHDRGWLRKYPGRLLMVTNGGCGVHCRFCFRRHFRRPVAQCPDDWASALQELTADSTLHEVILSGGDPLALEDDRLAELASRMEAIPHVRRLRIHTRFPIVVPQRVTDELLNWLCAGRLTTVMVVHVNHPAEIDADVAAALGRLVAAGVPVLSQTVLLRGVNGRIDVLAELFERLVDLRVIPYYLHQLDRVAGAAHFEVAPEEGVRLIQQLRARLPGYAVPRYVREVAGQPGKVVLA